MDYVFVAFTSANQVFKFIKKKTMIRIIRQQSCFFYILLLLVYLQKSAEYISNNADINKRFLMYERIYLWMEQC